MSKRPATLIDARDTGLRTLDLRQPLFDDAALARADDALQAMSGDMWRWLEADAARLQSARLAAEESDWSGPALEALFAVAHDIKGTGATYGSSLAGLVAASLCRLIETDAGKRQARRDPALLCAHVDALRAAVRERDRSDVSPLGRAVLIALEARVAALGVAPS